jgi:thiamine pyrophosphokinase
MSSHHIIREDQEPALLIMDVEAAEFDLTQELLEWSPTVIVHEDAVAQVLSWGIKIDVVIADASNIQSLTTSLHDQFPLKLVSCNSVDEALSTALYFLIAVKQKAVNILSFESLDTFEPFTTLDLSVFQSGKRWSYIRSGLYEKWLPAGRTVHIYPTDKQSTIRTDVDGVIVIRRENGFWVAEE